MNIDKVASVADIILGIWMTASMFLWRSSPVHMANAGAVGVCAVALGMMALHRHTWARWIVAALGIWLMLSLWLLPGGTVPMVINHLTIGTLLFGFSALPTGRGRATGMFAD